ncbi:uncharacterized protein LOC5512162 [Nematostella vectensis]|uniref:uncharacterized protein LOC5512162 n=1 Tax=Nematostella vectensis TaxID=45351 RepID=UPI002077317C|nr:uncharacterized protein LOC5512162 [Nematostella vectensis]
MEEDNELINKATTQATTRTNGQNGDWRALCDANQSLRIYFVNLKTKATQWLPPPELWTTQLGLPYGWEIGINVENTKYYINHVGKSATWEDPRSEADQATHLQMAAPRTRKIILNRDSSIGFGFVAGSERPVVIRSVITGGPSHGKLFANDQILRVNGEDVSDVTQTQVINLIKSCTGDLELHVIASEDLQDAKNQNQRRSSLMSRATRERRRSAPVNVRFADDISLVQYIGPAEQARRSSLPVLPNVLKVFLENGQTRSFRYDTKTSVQEIFESFGPKLGINSLEHFCLVLSGPQKGQFSLIQNHEKVSEVSGPQKGQFSLIQNHEKVSEVSGPQKGQFSLIQNHEKVSEVSGPQKGQFSLIQNHEKVSEVSGPQKGQFSLIQNHEKVSEVSGPQKGQFSLIQNHEKVSEVSGPQKGQFSLIQNHEKVSEVSGPQKGQFSLIQNHEKVSEVSGPQKGQFSLIQNHEKVSEVSGPQKGQFSLIQNHEKVSEVSGPQKGQFSLIQNHEKVSEVSGPQKGQFSLIQNHEKVSEVSGPQKGQFSLIQNHEKVSEVSGPQKGQFSLIQNHEKVSEVSGPQKGQFSLIQNHEKVSEVSGPQKGQFSLIQNHEKVSEVSEPQKGQSSLIQNHEKVSEVSGPQKGQSSLIQSHEKVSEVSGPQKGQFSLIQNHEKVSEVSGPQKGQFSLIQNHEKVSEVSGPQKGQFSLIQDHEKVSEVSGPQKGQFSLIQNHEKVSEVSGPQKGQFSLIQNHEKVSEVSGPQKGQFSLIQNHEKVSEVSGPQKGQFSLIQNHEKVSEVSGPQKGQFSLIQNHEKVSEVSGPQKGQFSLIQNHEKVSEVSGPQKGQFSLIQNHEKVSEVSGPQKGQFSLIQNHEKVSEVSGPQKGQFSLIQNHEKVSEVSGPQKGQFSLIQNHEKVSEVSGPQKGQFSLIQNHEKVSEVSGPQKGQFSLIQNHEKVSEVSGPQKGQFSLIQNHEKVSEVSGPQKGQFSLIQNHEKVSEVSGPQKGQFSLIQNHEKVSEVSGPQKGQFSLIQNHEKVSEVSEPQKGQFSLIQNHEKVSEVSGPQKGQSSLIQNHEKVSEVSGPQKGQFSLIQNHEKVSEVSGPQKGQFSLIQNHEKVSEVSGPQKGQFSLIQNHEKVSEVSGPQKGQFSLIQNHEKVSEVSGPQKGQFSLIQNHEKVSEVSGPQKGQFSLIQNHEKVSEVSGPQKGQFSLIQNHEKVSEVSEPQKGQSSLIQNHEKVSEIYTDRNCSKGSWVCKFQLCFLPRNPDALLEKDPVAFNYLYDQISNNIVEGYFDTDLKYDMAIKLAALHMQQKATEATRTLPLKITARGVEKEFDGLETFVPENLLNGVKTKELRKALEQQIKHNQSLAAPGQRYMGSRECKRNYLRIASELVSYGGKYFKVVLFTTTAGSKSRKARQQEATLLVSPKYGLSQVIKGKVNVLCQLADLDQITKFSISFHAEGKRLLKVSVNESKDILLLVSPLDSMDLVTFVIGYQKLWERPCASLQIEGQDPQTPFADGKTAEAPAYPAVHRVVPDSWSYPTFLQVPGNSIDSNFYVDLSKDPPQVGSSESFDDTTKRSSDQEDLQEISGNGSSGGNVDQVSMPKRLKMDPFPPKPSRAASLGLYRIAEEENHEPGNEQDEATEDDWINQLNVAEQMFLESKSKTENPEGEIKDQDSDESEEVNTRSAIDHDEQKTVDEKELMIDNYQKSVARAKASEEKPNTEQMGCTDTTVLNKYDQTGSGDKVDAKNDSNENGEHFEWPDRGSKADDQSDSMSDASGSAGSSEDAVIDFCPESTQLDDVSLCSPSGSPKKYNGDSWPDFECFLRPSRPSQEKDSLPEDECDDAHLTDDMARLNDDDEDDDDDESLFSMYLRNTGAVGAETENSMCRQTYSPSAYRSKVQEEQSHGFVSGGCDSDESRQRDLTAESDEPSKTAKVNLKDSNNDFNTDENLESISIDVDFESSCSSSTGEDSSDLQGTYDVEEEEGRDGKVELFNRESTKLLSYKLKEYVHYNDSPVPISVDGDSGSSTSSSASESFAMYQVNEVDKSDKEGWKEKEGGVDESEKEGWKTEGEGQREEKEEGWKKEVEGQREEKEEGWKKEVEGQREEKEDDKSDSHTKFKSLFWRQNAVRTISERSTECDLEDEENSSTWNEPLLHSTGHPEVNITGNDGSISAQESETVPVTPYLILGEDPGESEDAGVVEELEKHIDLDPEGFEVARGTEEHEKHMDLDPEGFEVARGTEEDEKHMDLDLGESEDAWGTEEHEKHMDLDLGESEDAWGTEEHEKHMDSFEATLPAEWLIPSPPPATEELWEIKVVSPPPLNLSITPTAFELSSSNSDGYVKIEIDEIERFILPPPPPVGDNKESVQTVSQPQREQSNGAMSHTPLEDNDKESALKTHNHEAISPFELETNNKERSQTIPLPQTTHNRESISRTLLQADEVLQTVKPPQGAQCNDTISPTSVVHELDFTTLLKRRWCSQETLVSRDTGFYGQRGHNMQSGYEVPLDLLGSLAIKDHSDADNDTVEISKDSGVNSDLESRSGNSSCSSVQSVLTDSNSDPKNESRNSVFNMKRTALLAYVEQFEENEERSSDDDSENSFSDSSEESIELFVDSTSENDVFTAVDEPNDGQEAICESTSDHCKETISKKDISLRSSKENLQNFRKPPIPPKPDFKTQHASQGVSLISRNIQQGNHINCEYDYSKETYEMAVHAEDKNTPYAMMNGSAPWESMVATGPVSSADDHEAITKLQETKGSRTLNDKRSETRKFSLERDKSDGFCNDCNHEESTMSSNPDEFINMSNPKQVERTFSSVNVETTNATSIELEQGIQNSIRTLVKKKCSSKELPRHETTKLDQQKLLAKYCLDAQTESLQFLEKLKKRLDDCSKDMNEPFNILQGSTHWIVGMQNNARFLARDVTLVDTNAKQLNFQVLSAMRTSLDTIQQLVNSCATASTTQQRVSSYRMRILIGIVTDVVLLYGELITQAQETVRMHDDEASRKRLSEKTAAMTTLIASLIRTLKRF